MLDHSAFRSENETAKAPRAMPWGRAILSDEALSANLAPAQMAADWIEAIAQDRDQAAFASLFRHYAPRIKTYLRRLGADEAAAEELAQEAMLALWRKAHLFDRRRAAAGAWIFAVARNLRIDRLRHERRPEFDPDDPLLVEDPAPPADEVLAAQARQRQVRTAMQTLPAEQAAVVTLSFFEDVPHSEIAHRLGLPLGTVKSRLRLAMQRIRSLLDPAP
jgi:RNA polymerase sigma-70 factor (ECF subfamily)